MKHLNFILVCALLTGCVQTIDTDFPSVNSKGEYAIQFGTKSTKASLTRISGTDYDNFNLYVWNSNNDTVMKPYLVEASGIGEYSYASVPGQELKYFSNTANSYYFTGVIPTTHKETVLGDTIKVDTIKAFTVDDKRVTGTLDKESPEEFLYAYKKVNKVDYGNTVTLPFKHENALIYLGFSSDRNDTKLLDYVPSSDSIPATYDTTFVQKFGATGYYQRNSSINMDALTDDMINVINKMYSLDGVTSNDWPTSGTHTLRVNTDSIPSNYRTIYTIGTSNTGEYDIPVFNAEKYLQDNNVSWPTMWQNIGFLIHVKRNPNGTCTGVLLSTGQITSTPNSLPIITEKTPTQPGVKGIDGIRVFSADSTNTYCVHIPHTMVADAYIDSTGCKLDNRVTSDSVIQFSLPATTTLSTTPVWSATTFYSLPGDANFNFIVVKFSYIYDGVTSYDVRVPIKLPTGGLQPGKYYKYEIKIGSTYNGTNDPNEAKNEKNEILIEGLHPIVVNLQIEDYSQGANQQIKI